MRTHADDLISVVIPVYKSAEALPELHRRVSNVLTETPGRFELIFVNDACPDDSLATLNRLAASDRRVIVHALPKNVGQQRAVLAGLALARGARVIVMDADLEDPPEAIPSLLAALTGGVSAAFLGRRGSHQPGVRRLTSRLFKSLMHRLCGTPRDAGLFAAMNRRMVDRLLQYDPPGPSVLAMMGCTGLMFATVPQARAPRMHGRSAYSTWSRTTLSVRAITWVLARKWRSAR